MEDVTAAVSHSKLLVQKPEQATDDVVLFLPGISGQAFSKRFDPLVQLVLSSGRAIARLHAWEDAEDVGSKTLTFFDDELRAALDVLQENGYVNVTVIGKSFGGGLVLAHTDARIKKKILWAPAIGIDPIGTFGMLKDTALENVKELLDIRIPTETVQNDPAAIRIIHGTADDVIPLTNSEEITAVARDGELHVIDGADHSFKTPEYEAALLAATATFLDS